MKKRNHYTVQAVGDNGSIAAQWCDDNFIIAVKRYLEYIDAFEGHYITVYFMVNGKVIDYAIICGEDY